VNVPSDAALLSSGARMGRRRRWSSAEKRQIVEKSLAWAHARRALDKLADIAANPQRGKKAPAISPLALEAVRRIDAVFGIERSINGCDADQRLAVRRELSAPLIADLEAWMRVVTAKMNDVDPQAWLADVLARIAELPQSRLHELLPWEWSRRRSSESLAA